MFKAEGILRYIPNLITLVNLGCGTLAINYIFLQNWSVVFVLIGIAALADFADGLIARLLGVSTPIGKELDSFADMVSFGVVPGLIFFELLLVADRSNIVAALPALLIPMASGLRLAKFNIQNNTSGDFIGLSTPAATALVLGILLIITRGTWPEFQHFLQQPATLYMIILVLAFLLISRVKMFSLKFKGAQWKGNEIRWLFILLFLLLTIVIKWSAVFWIIVLYILVSFIQHWLPKST